MTTTIAIAGDWHANLTWIGHALDAVQEQEIETLYHLGDFAYKMHPDLMELINEMGEDRDITIKFIDGNHENHDILPHDDEDEYWYGSHLAYLPRGYTFKIEGMKFMALGGAVSVDKKWRGPGEWWDKETITWKQSERAIGETGVDVMLTHDCPSGVPLTLMENVWPEDVLVQADAHRDLLRSIVDAVQPKYLFHGHYHQFHRGFILNNRTQIIGLDCDGADFNTISVEIDGDKIVDNKVLI